MVNDELSLLLWVAIGVVIAVGGFVHGALGLGFPLVTTPLLATMMDVRAAILITLLPTAAVNIVSLFKGSGWGEVLRQYWPMALASVLATIISTHWLIVSDPEPFRLLLAVIVLLYLGVSRLDQVDAQQPSLRRSFGEWVMRSPLSAKLAFGAVAGFSAGTTNVMVPILIIYALESRLAATSMVQVFNFCFLSGKATQIAVLSYTGVADQSVWLQNLPLAVLAVIILLLGMRIRAKLATETYQRIVRYLLAALAVLLLTQFTIASV